MKKLLLIALLFIFSAQAHADWEDELRQLKGYTLLEIATITGTIDSNGKRNDSFEGCEYGRKIIFDYNKTLTCNTYNYQYEYRPDAFIFVRNGNFIMIVDGEAYDMSR
jgi:hypothetical protein